MVIALYAPVVVAAQTVDARVNGPGIPDSFYGPCSEPDHFSYAHVSCSGDGATAKTTTAYDFFTGSVDFKASIYGGGASGTMYSADGFAGDGQASLIATGPVVPDRWVFYGAYSAIVHSTSDFNAVGSADFYIDGLEVSHSSGGWQDYTTSSPYTPGGGSTGVPFYGTVTLSGVSSERPYVGSIDAAFHYRFRGVDLLDASGHSLAGIDEVQDYYGHSYVLGDPDSYATTTPEPTSIALLGVGFVGLVPVVRRRRAVAHANERQVCRTLALLS